MIKKIFSYCKYIQNIYIFNLKYTINIFFPEELKYSYTYILMIAEANLWNLICNNTTISILGNCTASTSTYTVQTNLHKVYNKKTPNEIK